MRHSMKVAKWEIKRNLKNKSFLIGLFLTPIIILAFGFIGNWIGGDSDSAEESGEDITVFINDQLGVFPELEDTVSASGMPWTLLETDLAENEIADEVTDSENTAYLFLNQAGLTEGVFPIYTSEEIDPYFISQAAIMQGPVLAFQMEELGLTEEQSLAISQGVYFEEIDAEAITNEEAAGEAGGEELAGEDDLLAKLVPAAFAGIIFISIVFTGMAIFQSASQEKKDKIAEIILSSLTPSELMQGKIIGYFVLGLIQTAVLLLFVVPFILFQTDIPLLEYLFVPETALYVAIAVLNYLMFAAIFVGIGATMEDISTAGNFQGLVMMLPFLPFLFIGPVIGDPSGIIAQVGSYIPFTAPGVLLLRLAILDTWPWIEIIISLVIILISTGVFIKLAGKIFQVGILMYGKNATPGEIWKWIKA
ncbi:ABC transporter permease [Oceanobacillus sp. FSL H7-0719]|uniref:ABC transporter permease n=1 Tax=Oceanobacillus sp. FSL H7-0719 TaxID=2954507 RepID=UPI00324AA6F9